MVTKSGPSALSSRTVSLNLPMSSGALGKKNSNENTGRPLVKSSGIIIAR
jgi:hypothetical protein